MMQGYNLVSHNAAVSVAQSVLDAVGTALVLQCRWTWYSGTLTGVGVVSVANAAAACVAGLHIAAMLAPHDEYWSSCSVSIVAEPAQGLCPERAHTPVTCHEECIRRNRLVCVLYMMQAPGA